MGHGLSAQRLVVVTDSPARNGNVYTVYYFNRRWIHENIPVASSNKELHDFG